MPTVHVYSPVSTDEVQRRLSRPPVLFQDSYPQDKQSMSQDFESILKNYTFFVQSTDEMYSASAELNVTQACTLDDHDKATPRTPLPSTILIVYPGRSLRK